MESVIEVNRERLGAFIKAQRVRQGMTQKELAERVGQSTAYVYDIEAGKRANLGREKFFKWALALNADPKEFYAEAEEEYPVAEKPQRSIEIPYDLPIKAQEQIETFVKFIQYQEEFERFLKLYDNRPQEYEGTIDDFVDNLIDQEKQNRKNVS